MKTIVHALVVSAVLTTLAPAAGADPRRVVVLQFEGPKPWVEVVRRVVLGLIDDPHDVVPLERFNATARHLDVVNLTPRKVAAVARRAKVDAVVEGRVEGEGDKRVLALAVREARTGRVVDTISIPVASAKLISERDDLGEELLDLLDSVEPLDEEDAAWSDAPVEGGGGRGVPLMVSSLAETSGAAAPAAQEQAAAAPAKSKPVIALTAAVGVAASSRTLTFAFDPNLSMDEQPQGIDANPGAGLSLHGSALVIPAGLTATVSFDRSLGARLGYRDGGMVKQLSVSQRQLAVGVRAGRKVRKIGVHLGIGYREIAYLISNRPGTLLIPDARYALFEAGGGLRIPFRSELFAISAEGSYLQALSTSGITDKTAYGHASVMGFRTDVAFEVRATDSMTVRVGGEYVRLALAFQGEGRLSHSLDDDPGIDVAGAADAYLSGYVLASFAL